MHLKRFFFKLKLARMSAGLQCRLFTTAIRRNAWHTKADAFVCPTPNSNAGLKPAFFCLPKGEQGGTKGEAEGHGPIQHFGNQGLAITIKPWLTGNQKHKVDNHR
jgi:hypothetical protein